MAYSLSPIPECLTAALWDGRVEINTQVVDVYGPTHTRRVPFIYELRNAPLCLVCTSCLVFLFCLKQNCVAKAPLAFLAFLPLTPAPVLGSQGCATTPKTSRMLGRHSVH